MGTRNLTMVVSGGRTRIAQYGQWDGYPEGQGRTVLSFCRKYLDTPADRAWFAARLESCRFITLEEHKALNAPHLVGNTAPEGLIDMDTSDRLKRAHPQLNRDMGAKILEHVLGSTGDVLLEDRTAFAADSLFCEWTYVVDLDALALEVYGGFNKVALASSERFAHLGPEVGEYREYQPIKWLTSFFLGGLPTEEAFLAACKGAYDAHRGRS